MAKNDIRVRDSLTPLPVRTCQTEANATAIKAGEMVKMKALGSPYVIPVADAEPIIGTTTPIMGIAASDSTHTASADGIVQVYVPIPGVVYEAASKVSTDINTQAKINALVGDHVVIDLTSGVYTLDSSAGDGNTKGLQIVGGDATRLVAFFTIRPAAVEGVIA